MAFHFSDFRMDFRSLTEKLQQNGKLLLITCFSIIILMVLTCVIVFFLAIRGSEEVMVPNITGKELSTALLELQAKELYPKIQLRFSDHPDEKGTVLEQTPVPGSIVKAGRRISLIISRGVIIDRVENYIGQNIDELNQWVIEHFGAKGIAWLKVDNEGQLAGPIAKNFTPEELAGIKDKLAAKPGDFLLFSADTFDVTCKVLNGLRRRLAAELGLIDPKEMNFCWIVHFPMFAWDEGDGAAGEGRYVAMHHPFTAPRIEDLPLLDTDPGKIKAQAYDLVLNGFEVGGGTIRIHDGGVQQKVFGLLGLTEELCRSMFGFLLDALSFGAPPHGGIALGLDRLVMLFAGRDNIRDCIAFPKTMKASDLMTGAPDFVEAKQLEELQIKTTGTCQYSDHKEDSIP